MLRFNQYLFLLSYYGHDIKQKQANILLMIVNTLDFFYRQKNFLFTGKSRSPTLPPPQPLYAMASPPSNAGVTNALQYTSFTYVFMTCTWTTLSFYLTLLQGC
jgi:hypothetical protein